MQNDENENPRAYAEELMRAHAKRDFRFRFNIIFIILVAILVIDMWRAYRNESIWNQCVSKSPAQSALAQ